MVATLPRTEFARSRCTAFMPHTCEIRDEDSTLVYPVQSGLLAIDPENDGRCRVESARGKRADVLSPSDPMDANARSTSNWVISIPEQFASVVQNGYNFLDTITGLELTIGDIITFQSYEAEVRFVGVKQRIGTPPVDIEYFRQNQITGAISSVGTYTTQFGFDNSLPTNFSNQSGAGRSAYILGTAVILDQSATLRVNDRFILDGKNGEILSILVQSPDRFEAIVRVSVGGA